MRLAMVKPYCVESLPNHGNINNVDVIAGLKMLTESRSESVNDNADLDEDGRIGLADVIHVLE